MRLSKNLRYEEIAAQVRISLDEALLQCPDLSDAQLREVIQEAIRNQAPDEHINELNGHSALEQKLVDDLIGLGPIGQLLRDETVSEIMVNNYDDVFIEVGGSIHKSDISFSSETALRTAIERIVAPIGRRIDTSSPMVDARLPCGSRVNAVLPPVSLNGACLTIRKFNRVQPDMNYLTAQKTCNAPMAQLLTIFVENRCNIIVSGGTGSGKTTLLNALSGLISRDSRVITIEDSAELKIDIPNLVRLESRPENQEGKGQVSIRQLLSNALRMRPDRIIVGECRGAESLDMLQAMNTGHSGSMTTLHANSPSDALRRLETLVLMGDTGIPLDAVRAQILSAIHIVIQTKRLPDGRRVISEISELQGSEGGYMQLATLADIDLQSYEFRMSGEIPRLAFTLSEAHKGALIKHCSVT